MRVVICWSGISGYLAACWRTLAARPGIALKVITFDSIGAIHAPFLKSVVQGIDCDLVSHDYIDDTPYIAAKVAEFRPDVVVICGWLAPALTGLPFHPSMAKMKFAMGVDTPLQNTIRQRLARLKIGRLLDRMDRVIVAGERAWQYMRFLRVPESKLARGVYGIDRELFEPLHGRRASLPEGWPRRFLSTGRYVDVKGIDVLVEAHRKYSSMMTDPWPLTCCGCGPMESLLNGVAGIENLGFVQPADQAAVWEQSGAFVLASRFDPWPLVIVEACAAGLPVLCTEACGSAVELVRSHHNGLTVATNDADAMARAMIWAHEHHDRLNEMGARSRELASAYSSDRWADRWIHTLAGMI